MNLTFIIVALTCLTLAAAVLFKPSVTVGGHAHAPIGHTHRERVRAGVPAAHTLGTYWMVSTAGALLLIALSLVSPGEIVKGICADTAINPLKILVLFLSMSVMSVYLDEIGFFRVLADRTLRRAGTSRRALFLCLYLTVSVLTVFTSNDIIILTFTPFICYFTKAARIDPLPYLFAEFTAANTWSMLFIIGNPTNVYLATAAGADFLTYLSVMALPTLFGGAASFAMLRLLFGRKLNEKTEPSVSLSPSLSSGSNGSQNGAEEVKRPVIEDRGVLIIGLIHLGLCTLILTVSSYINVEMWLVTAAFAVSLFISSIIMKVIRRGRVQTHLVGCLKRMPWELVPFVLSMFVLVLALDGSGATDKIYSLMSGAPAIPAYGLASFFSANLINNIPMSVLFSSLVSRVPGDAAGAVYASVIGSNICAVLTPIGALAGIMWSGILSRNKVAFSFITFIKYGAAISLPTLLAALAGLALRLG